MPIESQMALESNREFETQTKAAKATWNINAFFIAIIPIIPFARAIITNIQFTTEFNPYSLN